MGETFFKMEIFISFIKLLTQDILFLKNPQIIPMM
jgi:hypothetical protein